VGDLLDGYAPVVAGTFDEMYFADGEPRAAYQGLVTHLETMSRADFDERCGLRDRAFRDQGITFALGGEVERPFPLDLVPRLLSAGDWTVIEAGIRQRVLALEAFLGDIYGTRAILRDGVLPHRIVMTSPHFHRCVAGIEPIGGVRIHVAGIDLVRDANGRFCVLEDNLRCPSGISYVIENRRAMTRVFSELFESHSVFPVGEYPMRLLDALRATAPRTRGDPTVVVLTPGVHNSAYFEHSFLARHMGVELVEGRDLICRDRVLFMRTTDGEQRVDVVYRRIDDEFLDPVCFRPDSLVGCPGLLDAARAGSVTIANMVGNGAADDKAIYSFVPAMIEYYLGERPILDNVPTYRLDDADVLSDCLARIDQLVWKPVDGSGGYGIVIGSHALAHELDALRTRVLEEPRRWIAQEPVALSTAPTFVDGVLAPRHVDLRPFAVNDGESIWVAPGGLTRVALPAGSLIVNSSQGGGSKDTWVVADSAAAAARELPNAIETGDAVTDWHPLARGPLDPGPLVAPLEQQQQQQQQTSC
jgi:uncharacterized circularly permuted ATP-grasp superfamily protein